LLGDLREVAETVQPPPDAALIDEQVVMVMTFLNGVTMGTAHGHPAVTDAQHSTIRSKQYCGPPLG
jgi:hypothetical protein